MFLKKHKSCLWSGNLRWKVDKNCLELKARVRQALKHDQSHEQTSLLGFHFAILLNGYFFFMFSCLEEISQKSHLLERNK